MRGTGSKALGRRSGEEQGFQRHMPLLLASARAGREEDGPRGPGGSRTRVLKLNIFLHTLRDLGGMRDVLVSGCPCPRSLAAKPIPGPSCSAGHRITSRVRQDGTEGEGK